MDFFFKMHHIIDFNIILNEVKDIGHWIRLRKWCLRDDRRFIKSSLQYMHIKCYNQVNWQCIQHNIDYACESSGLKRWTEKRVVRCMYVFERHKIYLFYLLTEFQLTFRMNWCCEQKNPFDSVQIHECAISWVINCSKRSKWSPFEFKSQNTL